MPMTPDMQRQATRTTRLLVLAWLVFMATTSAWIPAYKGDLGTGDYSPAIGFYFIIAALAAVSLRGHARTERHALAASLPALALVVAATVAAYFANRSRADVRGEPLFLFFSVALGASWAALIVATALLARTRWLRFGGLALTALVALFGFAMATFRVD